EVHRDDRRLQLIEREHRQQRTKEGAEQAALDEPVLVAESPVELAVGVERRGDALQNADQPGQAAGGERKISGTNAQRRGVPGGGCRRRLDYCCAPVTTTLMS